MTDTTRSEPRVVLVTGASSGFGRLTAEELARRGHLVFAALRGVDRRNKDAAAELRATAEQGAGLRVIELDVTDQTSADRALATIIETAGRLDAVVNNAGGIFSGPLEAFTAEEAHRQFDVNVAGPLRVARAALPHLRAQGRGVLIQIGSVAGRVTLPFTGLYAASKAALGSLTEAWRDELAPFGVESVIVEAASYPTNIGVNATIPGDGARMAGYGDRLGGFVTDLTKRTAQTGGDPRVVSDAVVALVETPDGERPLRTVVAPAAQADAVRTVNLAAAQATRAVATDMGVTAYVAGR